MMFRPAEKALLVLTAHHWLIIRKVKQRAIPALLVNWDGKGKLCSS